MTRLDLNKIMILNDALRSIIESDDSIMDLPIKIKLHSGLDEIAKPLLMPLAGKEIWQIIITCPSCEREQTILFQYSRDNETLRKLVKSVKTQMDYFFLHYCDCTIK